MEVNQGTTAIAEHIVEFAWTLLHHRCWSMAVRHHAPPNVYIGLKSSDPEKRKAAAALMKKHWERLMALEQRSLEYEPAKKLCGDLLVAKFPSVRLMYVLYERDQFRDTSAAGAWEGGGGRGRGREGRGPCINARHGTLHQRRA